MLGTPLIEAMKLNLYTILHNINIMENNTVQIHLRCRWCYGTDVVLYSTPRYGTVTQKRTHKFFAIKTR